MFKLPIKHITRLLIKAYEKQKENSAWELYVSLYPNMSEDTFISFEKFYNPQKKVEIEEKSEEEILREVKEILDTFNERR